MNIRKERSSTPDFLRIVKRDRDARELKIFISELQKRGIDPSVKIPSQGDEEEKDDDNEDGEQGDGPVPFDPRDLLVSVCKRSA